MKKILYKNEWFLQHRVNQLGNFVMSTPLLISLSEIYQRPIPVYFETDIIKTLYINAGFIKILKNKPRPGYIWSSCPPKEKNKNESDTECYMRLYADKLGYTKPIPNTYVDINNSVELDKVKGKKYIALFHGCFSPKNVEKKQLSKRVLQYMIDSVIDRGNIPVLLGNKSDNDNYWSKIQIDDRAINYIDKLSLKDSVSILNQTDLFLSNDTGLYHVAGALKKNGLVMWYKTDHIKNKCIFEGIEHCINYEGDDKVYMDSIKDFLDKNI